jgi:excisionase family DNA binding protein
MHSEPSRSTLDGDDRLVDTVEAARRMGVSRWTVRRLINSGALPTVRLPGPRGNVRRLLVHMKDVSLLISQSKEREEQ